MKPKINIEWPKDKPFTLNELSVKASKVTINNKAKEALGSGILKLVGYRNIGVGRPAAEYQVV
jgi:hypothetical protein